MNDDKHLISKARSKFIAMAAAYALGVFNDNFFKQAAMLLAVAAGKSKLQGIATVIFSLPFIIFSAHAGWLADKFAKKNVIIGTKILELAAMVLGAYGILTNNWLCIISMVGLMGFQSTLFSPALNGSIPELYPEWYVSKANAIVKLVTTLAILLGIALAGITLDQRWYNVEFVPFGNLLVSILVILVSILGVISSFKVNKYKIKKTSAPFPWLGPINSIKDMFILKREPELLFALIVSCFFYAVSSLIVLLLNAYGLSQLKYSQTLTGLLSVALMIGICIGSFLAAKLTAGKKWNRLIIISIFGISSGLLIISAGPLLSNEIQKPVLFSALVLTGCFGGMLLIPVASFIQIKPAENEKGKILGVCNFLDFSGILVSGQIFSIICRTKPSFNLFYLSIFCFLTGIIFYIKTRRINNEK
ncbi:MFS transporter [Candidatus Dependentiae bacterium]|nr:MFS transporter [Candidatus Dependentiae bacterium]